MADSSPRIPDEVGVLRRGDGHTEDCAKVKGWPYSGNYACDCGRTTTERPVGRSSEAARGEDLSRLPLGRCLPRRLELGGGMLTTRPRRQNAAIGGGDASRGRQEVGLDRMGDATDGASAEVRHLEPPTREP